MEEVSTVGWIATKFPQTSFHFARDLLSLFNEDNTLTKYELYQTSSEFNETLLQWFYHQQDPETGLKLDAITIEVPRYQLVLNLVN